MNQTETLQRFVWGFMRSGEAAREAPASGGASPYHAGAYDAKQKPSVTMQAIYELAREPVLI